MAFETRSRVERATNPTASPDLAGGRRLQLRGKTLDQQQELLSPVQLQQQPGQQQETSWMQDIAIAQDPNERERALLEQDAELASAWVQASAWAIGIAGTYAQTRDEPGRSTWLGRSDALRHCLWSAYLAWLVGPERAERMTSAHEDPVRPQSQSSAVDRQMDLHNNSIGHILGGAAHGAGFLIQTFALGFIAKAAIERIDSGELMVVDRTDPEHWRLVPSNTPGIS